MANNLIGVNSTDGKILWSFKYSGLEPEKSLKVWPGAPKINTITPLYKDGWLYVTGGYDHVGAMFRLSEDASSIKLAWTDSLLDCHHGGVVLIDGNIYGSNWIDNSRGNWCCIDWQSGKSMYEARWQTKGSVIAADRMLYLYDEKNGNVGLVRPDSEKFVLVSSFKIPDGKGPCWAHPGIKDGILYIRHGDVLMAYDIRKK
jgi:outer membrane protein assembly factor BamB